MTASPIFVGVAQAATATGSEALVTVGLGSCVAILLYDPAARVAGMAHVLLPEPHGTVVPGTDAKYATTAVPHLIAEMEGRSALRERMTARLVGGASMFGGMRNSPLTGAGERNLAAAREALERAGIPVVGEDVGLDHGRAVRISAADGKVRVTSYRRPDLEL